MSRPVVPLVVALMSGITCGYCCRMPDLVVQALLAGALIVLLLALLRRWSRAFYPSLLASLFLAGLLAMNACLYPALGTNPISRFIGPDKVQAEGIICENPQISSETTQLILCASRVLRNGEYLPATGRVLLNVRTPGSFRFGDAVRFETRLRSPRNFHNPGGFDYETHLRSRGVLVRGHVYEAAKIIVLRRDIGNPLRMSLERFRERVRQKIVDGAPEVEGRIIQAMILGEQSAIPKEVMEQFNRTGTTHIIAISGFNIGIVALFSFFVIRHLLKLSSYVLLKWDMVLVSTLFSILIVILYTFIAGAGISVIRASIMVVIFMIAILINRERELYNTLALAAFLILIVSPYSLFDISFQLSFAAVASLIFMSPRLAALMPSSLSFPSTDFARGRTAGVLFRKMLRGAVLFLIASFSATLGTLPLILLYFNRLSLVTLAANVIVVPILGVIAIPVSLLIVLAMALSPWTADLFIALSVQLVRISLWFIERFAALPFSSIFIPTPTLLEILSFYLLLLIFFFWLGWRLQGDQRHVLRKRILICQCLSVLLILFLAGYEWIVSSENAPKGRLSLTALDVGQGSSCLIRFPGGERMLVDGGGFYDGSFDVGRYVVAPALWHHRIPSIDIVVLTHPHPDHLQGLLFILENFHVREVWTNGDQTETPLCLAFLKIIKDRGITMKILSAGTPEMQVSGVGIRILNPLPPRSFREGSPLQDLNDRSLVLKLTYRKRSFLLPGDITEAAEKRLVNDLADLRCDVLFVPHHGAARSSSALFLEKVRPGSAVISCGFENVFRFPQPDTLERYRKLGTRVYRTDLEGAVFIATDGTDLKIRPFLAAR